LFWKTSSVPVLGSSKPALPAETPTCTEGGCSLQSKSFGEVPDASPNPFQTGITSTAHPAAQQNRVPMKQIWTGTLFKRSELFGSGSLAQRTTHSSVTVTGTVQKFPRQTPASRNKKQSCLPWHKTKLPVVLREKLLRSNSPLQTTIARSRHACAPIMCELHRAAHAAESALFPLLSFYKSTHRASRQPGSYTRARMHRVPLALLFWL